MIYVLVFLTQLASSQLQQIDDPELQATIIRLDDQREMVVKHTVDGRPVQALVRRLDGQRMTCDRYIAWFSNTYSCTSSCSSYYTVSGSATSNINRNAACEAARADACADATCSTGSYNFCWLVHQYSASLDAGTECSYSQFQNCWTADDCSVE